MDNEEDLYTADDTVPRQTSPLSRLPHELLIYVARLLNKEDFCALRLTSAYTSSILRVQLAREDFAGAPWRDNASRLDALSRWPECAQQIRRVRIRSRAVYGDEEQAAWSEEQADPEPALWPLRESSATARRLAAHPEERRIAPLKADLLCDALCRLKSLEELELTWERFPFMSRADLGLDVELAALGGDGDGDDDDVDSELAEQLEYTTGGWQVEMLVDLATDMQPLRALKVAPLALEAMDQASYLPLISNLFNSLVRLDLQLAAHAQRADPSLLSKLEDVLEGAWVLRELRLDLDRGGFAGGTEAERARHYARDFLPKTHMAHLQSLTLARGAVKLRDLGALLARHAATLRTLELRDMRGARPSAEQQVQLQHDGVVSWEDLLRGLRADVPKLERATLRGHFVDHAREICFKADGDEEEEGHEAEIETDDGVRLGEGANGEGSSSLGRAAERMPTADPEPLERYLVRLGEFPTLEWKGLHV
ncbi:hypothetical protein PWT90_09566 [Aphanocladium album]|nr:hypothetical protein PWT90_09566 [Aphanocladium album]